MALTSDKIAVTGGSGGAGYYIIQELMANGYECLNIDKAAPRVQVCPFLPVDLKDYDATFSSLSGVDAVVHFAANPHPDDDHVGAAENFENNTVALFNVFNSARAHGVKRVVWASSETVYGFPFASTKPLEIPVTEDAPLQPQSGYALSKLVSEELAVRMARLYEMTFVGLRLSNILYDDASVDPSYQKIPTYWKELESRKFNLWGYIDARDAAKAVRLSLEVPLAGAHVFNIAAADTIMRQDSRTLLSNVFPETRVTPNLGKRQAMVSTAQAQKVLGWVPDYTWNDVLELQNEDY